jgi:hypothetical protein
MEKCALLISANESYQTAEKDLEELSGIKISHIAFLNDSQNFIKSNGSRV